MKIETKKLESLFQQLIHKLNEMNIDSVEVNTNFYLMISSIDWTKVGENNPEPVMGSLIDDWSSLSKVADGENPMMFVDFDRLASVLRAISEELNPEM